MKKIAFSILIFAACAGALEWTARQLGFAPWTDAPDNRKPKAYEFDPVRGWRNKPGVYQITYGTTDVVTTHTAGGARATGPGDADDSGRPAIVLVGCSITEGTSISDWETLGWKLQQRFPQYEVINFGTGGYGAYQSLLLLEDYFQKTTNQTLAVVYGGWIGHADRDVAVWWYFKEMALRNRGQFQLPYADVDAQNRLSRYPPARFRFLALQRRSALFTAGYDLALRLRGRGRERRKVAVWKAVITEMDKLCARHGARFGVAMLIQHEEAPMLQEFFDNRGIRFVDCCPPDWEPNASWKVPLDGHPSDSCNTYYLDQLAPKLVEWLR